MTDCTLSDAKGPHFERLAEEAIVAALTRAIAVDGSPSLLRDRAAQREVLDGVAERLRELGIDVNTIFITAP
ncbi:hypothetical protein GVX82_02950 [Patescibacteria group bacterium]|nr:hypothetical protein [Patescibacteria group bacterium]